MNLVIPVGDRVGTVSGLLTRPPDARVLYLLAHGAGAGMHHRFMAAVADVLGRHGIATLRYQFPYTEAGGRRPDPPVVLEATVRAAAAAASEVAPDLPVVAGGKSMGGRMTSGAQARRPLDRVAGLVFLGFPLHPARQPATTRADHLAQVKVPMLFLQGTRDELAEFGLIERTTRSLGDLATLHAVQGADHAFEVLKRSGRTNEDVLEELASAVAAWCRARGLGSGPERSGHQDAGGVADGGDVLR
jgi:predicted alpha/beta-hydrolase family hydrolase